MMHSTTTHLLFVCYLRAVDFTNKFSTVTRVNNTITISNTRTTEPVQWRTQFGVTSGEGVCECVSPAEYFKAGLLIYIKAERLIKNEGNLVKDAAIRIARAGGRDPESASPAPVRAIVPHISTRIWVMSSTTKGDARRTASDKSGHPSVRVPLITAALAGPPFGSALNTLWPNCNFLLLRCPERKHTFGVISEQSRPHFDEIKREYELVAA
ncbi:hypothetical protein EVAR_63596_1 [Eumeta japonica]|uniref:Uncharacterized protein n=1 Tax=Eumeta variegata TaxID=151549 RepID=A0A4C1ZP40_EUMVA|nr:hypothetical protein EVAR_63596_1 [Eumeta japonica]